MKPMKCFNWEKYHFSKKNIFKKPSKFKYINFCGTSHYLITVVTPRLLHFTIFCQIFENMWLKTPLSPGIPPDCYTFLTFFVTLWESLLYDRWHESINRSSLEILIQITHWLKRWSYSRFMTKNLYFSSNFG